MNPSSTPPARPFLRRYGPLIAILAALGVVAGVVVATRGGSPTSGSATKTAASAAQPAGVLSWSQAKAEGKTKSIDWGSRCNTATGTLAYPSYFAGQCYAPFKGSNGGATYQGVTGNSIKVVLYLPEPNDPVLSYVEGAIADTDTNPETIATVNGYVKFLQTYYEMYGRKIDLIPFVATGNATDEVAARADATTIAESIKPFAVLGGPVLTASFGQEIIASKIFCVACIPSQANSFYVQHSPYVIGLGMNADEGQIELADYIGAQLGNRPAAFAGDPAMRHENRKFGLVYISDGSKAAAAQASDFVQSLAKRGVKLTIQLSYTSPVNIDAVGIISKLKAAGVTSVILTTDPVAPGPLTRAATSQNYFPEWIITGAALTDSALFARTYDQKQWAHAFGMTDTAARTSPSVSGSVYLYHWFFGKNPPAETGAAVITPLLTLLFVALQATGPDVTPANVLAALFAAPKPREALTEPMITYGNHGIWPVTDYQGVDDATEIWWNPNAVGPDELNHVGRGMYEYVNGGKRYLPGDWPQTAPDVFSAAGAVTIYNTVPAAEAVPNYPSPASAG